MSTIGALRRRIQLFAPLRTPDGAGGFSESWNAQGEVWARIVPLASAENAEADGLKFPARFRVELRAPNPLQAGWRVFWRSHWHRVDSVQAGETAGEPILIQMTEMSL